MVLGSEKEERL